LHSTHGYPQSSTRRRLGRLGLASPALRLRRRSPRLGWRLGLGRRLGLASRVVVIGISCSRSEKRKGPGAAGSPSQLATTDDGGAFPCRRPCRSPPCSKEQALRPLLERSSSWGAARGQGRCMLAAKIRGAANILRWIKIPDDLGNRPNVREGRLRRFWHYQGISEIFADICRAGHD
jgi:hypothetical protein